MGLKIKQHLAKANHKKGINKPRYIVIHDVGALGQAMANANYFHTEARGASAHYFVDPKEIVQVVKDQDAAYHVGDGHTGGTYGRRNITSKSGITNLNSVGIEMCLDPNAKSHADSYIDGRTVALTIALTIELMERLNIPLERVVRHYDASGKNCPGRWRADNWKQWHAFIREVKRRMTSKDTPDKAVDNHVDKDVDAYIVKKGDTLWGIAKQFNTSVSKLKQLNNLKSDVLQIGARLELKVYKNTHVVEKNDTLWELANRYNTTIGNLKQWNGLTSNVLQIGQKLAVKGGQAPIKKAKPAPAPKVDAFKLPNTNYWVKSPQFKGNGVRTVQKALASLHFYPEKGAKNNGVDGYYGNKTADAVKRFQSMYGLKQDGNYGPQTRKKLDQIVNK